MPLNEAERVERALADARQCPQCHEWVTDWPNKWMHPDRLIVCWHCFQLNLEEILAKND